MEPVRVGVIGIGGFARTHLDSLDRCEGQGLSRLESVVVPLPWNAQYNEEERESEIRRRGVRVYRSYEEMFEGERGRIDLVTVPVGIHLHAPASIAALRAGFNVLCEKPAAGGSAGARDMKDARESSGRILAIGYQHLHTPAIQRIKGITLSGELGRLLNARTLVLWPRESSYYGRNGWAGKLSVNGVQILDSPLQNAAAHFLQNMLYVAGPGRDECAEPVAAYGENYHANDIESADTQFLRITTESGSTLVFVASHAVPEQRDPQTEFRYEHGRILWNYDGQTSVFRTGPDGRETLVEAFDNGNARVHDLPFFDVMRAIRESGTPLSHIGNAIQHIRCVEAAFASSGGVVPIPKEFLEYRDTPNGTITLVRGIVPELERAYESTAGFGEGPTRGSGTAGWAVPSRVVTPVA